jgi:23S rRNA (uracil1939-C5)-methyltransferase
MPNVSEQVELSITSVSQTGAGVGINSQGKKFFVPGSWIGDEVLADILPNQSSDMRYRQTHLKKILVPSSARVTPACASAGHGDHDCPCCPWIGIDYQAQLQQKQQFLLNMINKLNIPFESNILKEIIPSEKILGHRLRAQFKCNGKKIGYMNSKGSDIVAINDCPIMIPSIRHWLGSVASQLPNSSLAPSPGYQFNFIDIDDDIVDHSAKNKPVILQDIILNQRRPFKQANGDTNKKILNWLAEIIKKNAHRSSILELFAGRGNLSSVIAPLAHKLWAAEVDNNAIPHLQKIVRDFPHTIAIQDNLFDMQGLKSVLKIAHTAQGLILNPPRDGLKMRNLLLDELPNLQWIAYISCTPEKMLADAKAWSKRWRLIEIRGIDQFPHTPHLEAVAYFEKL